ncbi:hypothetical protein DP20_1195 [Shigella flexneri]|nr:hypothetical protein DP20_1195 [Shigella flexneri]
MTWWSVTSLRWHYPDQVIRVFLSLHAEGHPESFGCDDKSQRRMVMSSAPVVNEEKRQFYNRVNKLFDI